MGAWAVPTGKVRVLEHAVLLQRALLPVRLHGGWFVMLWWLAGVATPAAIFFVAP